MPDEVSPEQNEAICQAIYAGRKIEAIKLYREATGKGLKESKEFIEAVTDRLREQSPEKFAAPQGGSCGATVLLLVVVSILIFFWTTP